MAPPIAPLCVATQCVGENHFCSRCSLSQTRVGGMVRLVEGRIVPDEEEGSSRCAVSTINIVGFQVPPHWAAVVALLAFVLFGPSGLVILGMIAVISHFVSIDSRSGGGWRRRRHDGLGSNVRGMDDIPKPVRRS